MAGNNDPLETFYVREGRYEAWAKGEAVGDSITPSTYSAAYRAHILSLISDFAQPRSMIVSIGCGNCAVEKELTDAGYDVLCTDLLPECAPYAVRAGARFAVFDVLQPDPEVLRSRPSLIYADGVLGHLVDVPKGPDAFMAACGAMLGKEGYLLISNDGLSTAEGNHTQRNADVPAFHFLNEAYLDSALPRYGFEVVRNAPFLYERPKSGTCRRVVTMARRSAA